MAPLALAQGSDYIPDQVDCSDMPANFDANGDGFCDVAFKPVHRTKYIGYVGTKGRVLEARDGDTSTEDDNAAERFPVWADYLPGRELIYDREKQGNARFSSSPADFARYEEQQENGVADGEIALLKMYLNGPVKRIGLAVDDFEDARVVSYQAIETARRDWDKLLVEYAGRVSVTDIYDYKQKRLSEFRDDTEEGNEPAFLTRARASTTHVLIWNDQRRPPGAPTIVAEMPIDPDEEIEFEPSQEQIDATPPGEEPLPAAVLVGHTESAMGKFLHASAGSIAYLTDYFSTFESRYGYGPDHPLYDPNQEDPADAFEYFGFCDPRTLENKFAGYDGSPNLATRFQRCDHFMIRDVWGAIQGARVSTVSTVFFEPTYTDHTGYFELPYTYPRGYLSVSPSYVKVRLGPHDPRGLGTLYMGRQMAVHGDNFGEVYPEIAPYQFGAAPSYPGKGGLPPGPEDNPYLPPPIYERSLNFPIDAVAVSASVQLVNAPPQDDPEIFYYFASQMTVDVGHPGIQDVDPEYPLPYETIYDHVTPQAGQGQFLYMTQTDGVQRQVNDPPDLHHRGLLKQIKQGDLLNTDFYVFETDAFGNLLEGDSSRLIGERRGATTFELDGLVAAESKSGWGICLESMENGCSPDKWYVMESEPNAVKFDSSLRPPFDAILHPKFLVKHPGEGYYKLYAVNRVSGYIGSTRLALSRGDDKFVCDDGTIFDTETQDETGFEQTVPISYQDGTKTDVLGTTRVGQDGLVPIAKVIEDETGQKVCVEAPLFMRPPNLTIRAVRTNEEAVPGAEQDISMEGAGLTSDTVTILAKWVDEDGSPLPSRLPGFSGRLSIVTGTPEEPELQDVSVSNGGEIEHFDINPSVEETEVLVVPQEMGQHYYVHVGAVPRSRCDDGSYKIGPEQNGIGYSAGCETFETLPDAQGPLRYRPKNYVPFKVPIYDEIGTRDALRAVANAIRAEEEPTSVVLAEKAAEGEEGSFVHNGVQYNEVKPVYRYLYRPELQFTLYELDVNKTDTQVITQFHDLAGRTHTYLDFAATLTGPMQGDDPLNPLPSWGPDRELLWGVGYGEFLALADGQRRRPDCEPGNAPCELVDLDSLVELQPTAQLGHVEGLAAGTLTEADYLALQLYSATDAGNVLFHYDLGYPIVQAEPLPFRLTRYSVQSDMAQERLYDEYEPLRFAINEPSQVRIIVADEDGEELEELHAQNANKGEYVFPVDFEAVQSAILAADEGQGAGQNQSKALDAPQKDYRVEVHVCPVGKVCQTEEGEEVLESADFAALNIVRYKVWLRVLKIGEPPGQQIAHDIRLSDGSLQVYREDFAIPGAGPSMLFERHYSNFDTNSDGAMGEGWHHSLDDRLLVLADAKTDDDLEPPDPGYVPKWVDDAKKDGLQLWDDVSDQVAPDSPEPTTVMVQGTTFKLTGEAREEFASWEADDGYYLKLRQKEEPCADWEEPPDYEDGDPKPGCFEVLDLEGTMSFYDVPMGEAGRDEVLTQTDGQFSLSLADQLAYRAGYMDLEIDGREFELGVDGKAQVKRVESSVHRVRDRWGSELEFAYYTEADAEANGALEKFVGLLKGVTDKGSPNAPAVGQRTCQFHYTPGAGGITCGEDGEEPGPPTSKVRLHGVSCLTGTETEGLPQTDVINPGTSSVVISVGFCYDQRGNLTKAQRGEVAEKYTYLAQDKPDGSACVDEFTESESGSGDTGTGGSGTGGSGSGGSGTGGSGTGGEPTGPPPVISVHPDIENGAELLDGSQAAQIGYDTSSDDPPPDPPPAPEKDDAPTERAKGEYDRCAHNLEIIQSQVRDGEFHDTEFAYRGGTVDLQIPSAKGTPGAEIVGSVKLPPVDAEGAEAQTLEVAYSARNRSVDHLGSFEPTFYSLDDAGHPTSIEEDIDGMGKKTSTIGWGTADDRNAAKPKGSIVSYTVSGPKQSVTTTYTYGNGRLTESDTKGSGGGTGSLRKVVDSWQPASIAGIDEDVLLLQSREVTRGVGTVTESWTYDALGTVATHTDRAMQTWIYAAYGPYPDQIGSITAPGGGGTSITAFAYDEHGNPKSTTETGEASSVTATRRNSRGEIAEFENANGAKTLYAFDSNGRVRITTRELSATGPGVRTVVFGQGGFGVSSLVVNYDGAVKSQENDFNGVQYTYDDYTPRGLVKTLKRVAGNLEHTRTFTYDGANNLITETDWTNSAKTTYVYNGLNYPTSIKNRAGEITSFGVVDVFGNVWEMTAGDQAVTEFEFDGLSRQTRRQVKDCARPAECPNVTTTHDVAPRGGGVGAIFGSITTVPLASGDLTTYTDTDALDRVVLSERVEGSAAAPTTYEYDVRSNLTKMVDPMGLQTTYSYDGRNRQTGMLVSTDGSSGFLTTYAHDAVGNVISEGSYPLDIEPARSLTGASGGDAITAYVYDAWNRLVEVNPPDVQHVDGIGGGLPSASPATATTTYDGLGNVLSMTDHRGGQHKWARNQLGWVLSYDDASESDVDRSGCGFVQCFASFDANGNPATMTNARGLVTAYTYDAEERISTVDEGGLRSAAITGRDGVGRPRTLTAAGVNYTFDYNEVGAVKKETIGGTSNDQGTVSQPDLIKDVEYDGLGRRIKLTSTHGGSVVIESNLYGSTAAGVEVEVQYPEEGTFYEKRHFDLLGQQVASRSRFGGTSNGTTEHIERDPFRRVQRIWREHGSTEVTILTATHYANGKVRTTTDTDTEFETSYEYDLLGRPQRIRFPDAANSFPAVELRAYDGNGNLVARGKPTGGPGDTFLREVMTYDGENRLTSRTEGGLTHSWAYDVLGNLKYESSPRAGASGDDCSGQVRVYEYDSLSRVTSIDDRGLVVEYEDYDERGNVGLQTIPGSRTSCEGETGSCSTVPEPIQTRFTYDVFNRPHAVERQAPPGENQQPSSSNLTTTYSDYDVLGNPGKVDAANGASYDIDYDAHSRRRSLTITGGSPSATYNDLVALTWDFDDEQRQLTVGETKAEESDSTVITLDPIWGRPQTIARSQGGKTITVTNGYNGDGTREFVSTDFARTDFVYNSRNQLQKLTAGMTDDVEYSYFADGRSYRTTHPGDVTTTHAYDGNRRLASVTATGGDLLVRSEYEYDPDGNPAGQTEIRGDETHRTGYTYDCTGRLLTDTYLPDGATLAERNYYEFVGYNRSRVVRSAGALTTPPEGGAQTLTGSLFDEVGLGLRDYEYTSGYLTSVIERNEELSEVATTTFVYDEGGNTTEKLRTPVDSQIDPELKTFEFDRQNRLKGIREYTGLNQDSYARFDYDFAGRRVRERGSDRDDRDVFFNGGEAIEEHVPGGGGFLLARYHSSDRPAVVDSRQSLTGSLGRHVFHRDVRNTTTHLTSATDGSTSASYMVDSWGSPRGPAASSIANHSNRKLYTGHEYFSSADLHYMRARWMDPSTGRFLSEDPFLGWRGEPASLHRYGYAHQNPVTYTDPSGEAIPLVLIGIASVAALIAMEETANAPEGEYTENGEWVTTSPIYRSSTNTELVGRAVAGAASVIVPFGAVRMLGLRGGAAYFTEGAVGTGIHMAGQDAFSDTDYSAADYAGGIALGGLGGFALGQTFGAFGLIGRTAAQDVSEYMTYRSVLAGRYMSPSYGSRHMWGAPTRSAAGSNLLHMVNGGVSRSVSTQPTFRLLQRIAQARTGPTARGATAALFPGRAHTVAHRVDSMAGSARPARSSIYESALDQAFGRAQTPQGTTGVKLHEYADAAQGTVRRNPTLQVLDDGKQAMLDPDGKYLKLWLVDEHGVLRIAEEVPAGMLDDRGMPGALGHPTLTVGARARVAGELHYRDGRWVIDNNSGRFSMHHDRTRFQLENAQRLFKKAGVDVDIDFNPKRLPADVPTE